MGGRKMKNRKIITFFILASLFVSLQKIVKAKTSISVTYFENLSGKPSAEKFKKSLTQFLIINLLKVKDLDVIEREELQKLMQEIELGMTGLVDEASAPKMGRLLGAQFILTGNYLLTKKEMLLNYKLIEVETSKIKIAKSVSCKPDNIFPAIKQIVYNTAKALNRKPPVLKEITINLTGALNYGEALDLKDKGEYKHAKEILNSLKKDGFSTEYIKSELASIEKRLKEYEEKRKKEIEKLKQSPVTWENFNTITAGYLYSQKYEELIRYCINIRKNPSGLQGSPKNALEIIDYYIITGLFHLNKWDQMVKAGEEFLKNYPTSGYYPAVKSYINQAITQTKELELNRKRLKNKLKPLINKLKSADKKEKSYIYYQIAYEYFLNGLYKEALVNFKKINLKYIKSKGIYPDFILFNMFMCYCNLNDKKNALKVYKTLKTFYPDSPFISTLESFINRW